jgi:hypothetical protein
MKGEPCRIIDAPPAGMRHAQTVLLSTETTWHVAHVASAGQIVARRLLASEPGQSIAAALPSAREELRKLPGEHDGSDRS